MKICLFFFALVAFTYLQQPLEIISQSQNLNSTCIVGGCSVCIPGSDSYCQTCDSQKFKYSGRCYNCNMGCSPGDCGTRGCFRCQSEYLLKSKIGYGGIKDCYMGPPKPKPKPDDKAHYNYFMMIILFFFLLLILVVVVGIILCVCCCKTTNKNSTAIIRGGAGYTGIQQQQPRFAPHPEFAPQQPRFAPQPGFQANYHVQQPGFNVRMQAKPLYQ